MDDPIRIIQLTDLHLFGDAEKNLLTINTRVTLEKTIELLKKDLKQKKAELIAITGDLSQDYSEGSYRYVKEVCEALPAPTAIVLGNHDDRPTFEKIFGTPLRHNFLFGGWQLILLNSHWQKHVAGFLASEDLIFLQDKLAANPEKQTMIFVHHHTLPCGCQWLDRIAIANSELLLKLIEKYKNVKAVICGHIHQESQKQHNKVDFFSTPSTSFQFAPGSDTFQLSPMMPGYRWIDLYPDGSFDTAVVRIGFDAKLLPPLDSSGY